MNWSIDVGEVRGGVRMDGEVVASNLLVCRDLAGSYQAQTRRGRCQCVNCSSRLYIDCIVNRALTTHCLLWVVRPVGYAETAAYPNRGNHRSKAVTRNLFISHPVPSRSFRFFSLP